jgi:hypothetical protein
MNAAPDAQLLDLLLEPLFQGTFAYNEPVQIGQVPDQPSSSGY